MTLKLKIPCKNNPTQPITISTQVYNSTWVGGVALHHHRGVSFPPQRKCSCHCPHTVQFNAMYAATCSLHLVKMMEKRSGQRRFWKRERGKGTVKRNTGREMRENRCGNGDEEASGWLSNWKQMWFQLWLQQDKSQIYWVIITCDTKCMIQPMPLIFVCLFVLCLMHLKTHKSNKTYTNGKQSKWIKHTFPFSINAIFMVFV